MPQEQIDLDKIIATTPHGDWFSDAEIKIIKNSMREACRQILALASERATIKQQAITVDNVTSDYKVVDKESVTSCINLIKP